MAQSAELLDHDVQIHLTLAQCNLLLEALVERPFKQVFELIGILNQQLQPFYRGANPEVPIPVRLHRLQLSLCVKALGELPYHRVATLLGDLHRQLLAQSPNWDAGELWQGEPHREGQLPDGQVHAR